jgi:tetratricopeptide (TPR) repeat protein
MHMNHPLGNTARVRIEMRRRFLAHGIALAFLVAGASARAAAQDSPRSDTNGSARETTSPPNARAQDRSNAQRGARGQGMQTPPGVSTPPSLPPGVTREQMWPAPTAEDWKKPCLIHWQRTWEDAVAVSRETKKPILICVNMDGEVASEHYAGVRYRQPDMAKLYEPYVCVIASVYRHNPRDYDEEGNRILCPRFGSVTCGEHIWIEPGLFEKFFDGKRVAPRHIMVELDQQETFDVYYAWDTDTIFNSLKKGIADRTVITNDIPRGDRPIVDLAVSKDNEDRTALELAYRKGDREKRRALLDAVAVHPLDGDLDMLRLAIFGYDVELAKTARRLLAQSNSPEAVDLIADALRIPMDPSEREALIAALVRLGETTPRAKTLAAVFQGLSGRSTAVDVQSWSKALTESAPTAVVRERYALESQLESRARSADSKPADAEKRIELAESYLALAVDRKTERKYSRVLLEDARRTAAEARELGANPWRVNSTLALCAANLGNADEAHTYAELAMKDLPADPQGWNACATLALFAEARQEAISKALREKKEWPSQWLTDVHAAYSIIAHHPFGTDAEIVSHYDFLRRLGAAAEAGRVLDEGLTRFPDSWLMHDRLRGRILAEKGADGLEPAYELRLADKNAAPSLESFAGYASLVAAEFHRRAGRDDDALTSYEHGIAHYERAIAAVPESRATSDHFIALALAGRARIELQRGDLEHSLADLLASFERKPEAAASLDGLNISPVDTAKMLRARLADAKRDDLVAQLQAALDKLDPEFLQLPAYEREGPDTRPNVLPPRRRAAQQGR